MSQPPSLQLEVIGMGPLKRGEALLPRGVQLKIGPPQHLPPAGNNFRVTPVIILPGTSRVTFLVTFLVLFTFPRRVVLGAVHFNEGVFTKFEVAPPSAADGRLRFKVDPRVARP